MTTDLADAIPPETQAPQPPVAVMGLAPDLIQRAKLIASHLLLPDGATVIDMECETGALTLALAHFCPRLQFVGIDRNRQMVAQAAGRLSKTGLTNLRFDVSDSTVTGLPDDSVDAIVNSRVIGAVYTRNTYSEAPVIAMLAEHFRILKPEGLMVMYDYPMPRGDEFVEMEFPVPRRDARQFRLYANPVGETQGEREIALLQWFSENARARDTVRGFYCEEIAPRVPYTRLFRLPAKWAYEFTIRKQNPAKFKAKIAHEYTCFTPADFDRVFGTALGARVLYTGPWRNPQVVKTHFQGSFRLYTSAGKTAPYPPTGYVLVAQKLGSGQDVSISELRPSAAPATSLSVQSVRNEESGEVLDVVAREDPRVEVLPYCRGADGRLKLVLRSGAIKGLVNTSPRAVHNLDGKKWSGHVIAPLSVSVHDLADLDRGPAGIGAVTRLMVQNFGLRPVSGAHFEDGPKGFVAPSLIDERQDTLYIEITPPDLTGPRAVSPFDALKLKLYDAEDILRATNAGFIPNAWLDIQVQTLLRLKGQAVTPWLHEALSPGEDPPPEGQMVHAKKILAQRQEMADKAKATGDLWAKGGKGSQWPKVAGKFRPLRGGSGQVHIKKSSFVIKGVVDGAARGLSAFDMDFATPGPDHMNIAAILPLTADLQGNTLVGFELKEMPVPSRYGQDQAMMTLPTLPLPAHITHLDEARDYVADAYEVSADRVAPMGESFFTHIDMVPQRVFPFALTRIPYNKKTTIRYAPLDHILALTDTDFADSVLWKWGLAYAFLCQDSQQSYNWGHKAKLHASPTKPGSPQHGSLLGAGESGKAWVKPESPRDTDSGGHKPFHVRAKHKLT